MHLKRIDIATGLFKEDVIVDNLPIDGDGQLLEEYIQEPVPEGFYHPKWTGTKWVEGGKPPEPQPIEPTETELLQAQVKASNDYMDFLEEVIVEIAQTVYK